MSSFSFVNNIFSSTDAKRWFLQILRCLRCEKCGEGIIIPGENFPIETGESPVILKTTCFGLHFFVPDPVEEMQLRNLLFLVLNVDYCHLGGCELKGNELYITTSIRGGMREFTFKTEAASAIKEVIDKYSTEMDRQYALSKCRNGFSYPINVEPQNSSPAETISTSIFEWSPRRRFVGTMPSSSSNPTQTNPEARLSLQPST